MKKILVTFLLLIALQLFSFGQYFQGTIVNSNNTLIFKMKPTGDLNVSIAYIELCFRYQTAGTPAFSISNVVNGSAAFPGINMLRRTDYISGPYTYIRFVHNTSTIAAFNYLASNSAGYEIMRLDLTGGVGTGDFEMASDLVDPNNETVFGVVKGDGNFIDPGAGAQLYGPGFNIQGNFHLLPLTAPLPVNWLDFSVIRQNNDVVLKWTVAQELNNDHYEIERSTDGINFSLIANKPSLGSYITKTYDHLDPNIKTLNADLIYYRIKQVDIDGKFTYSPVRTVKLSKGDILVYPNPAKSGFTVSIPFLTLSDKNVLLKLENAAGQLVEQRTITIAQAANYYFGFSGAKVLPGNYTLKIYNENELLSVKKISVSR